ncbi:hypothetical protein [Methylobacterium iners]|uniref:hypothetical protein n=1 Tax=Methylobacterium iners TaxID=418707 RepID=UPI001EE38170|nr:hypothetical protein [Methylobacterium iners]
MDRLVRPDGARCKGAYDENGEDESARATHGIAPADPAVMPADERLNHAFVRCGMQILQRTIMRSRDAKSTILRLYDGVMPLWQLAGMPQAQGLADDSLTANHCSLCPGVLLVDCSHNAAA